ncbi:hypothetical protein BDV37DRAFT_262580 [Aspergillus pseudonomiae]|uniref:Uncharacterized protein n=1 Tax=Aspergillus pseudonomiae TaxID=1506151 RepID=A0A5N7CWY9_9EURO|nr:uncharacterized protein BDV37DRAFT_262580 [Aspergillus pseudonomiae]KAE8398695.1 hypothetical protein BDV37DRAFT_262580 [Aspergillus pseudonomiae]
MVSPYPSLPSFYFILFFFYFPWVISSNFISLVALPRVCVSRQLGVRPCITCRGRAISRRADMTGHYA